MTDRSELEAQIAAAPQDDTALLVYGDWLLQHGDPRGELIALDDATRRARGDRGTWRRRREALLARHPDLAPPVDRDVELEWHLGFVRRVDLARDADVRAVLEHPALAFVQTVVFRDGPPAAEVWPQLHRPTLRGIAIGRPDGPRWSSELSSLRVPYDLDPLLAALPALEHVYLREPVQLTAGRVSSLDLGVIGGDTLPMICRAQLPRLERLVLQFSPADWLTPLAPSEALDDLRAMIAAPPRTLAELELTDVDGDAAIAALVGSPLLAQLRRLRLWNPNLSIEGVRRITRDVFGHVALELADPLLDDTCVARLAEVFPDVETISPRMREILRRPR